MSGLVPATASTDTTPPTSTITSPSAGANSRTAAGHDHRHRDRCRRRGRRRRRGLDRRRHDLAPGHDHRRRRADRRLDLHAGSPTATRRRRSRPAPSTTAATSRRPRTRITVNVACPCSIWGTDVTPPPPDSGDASADRGRREVHVRHLRHGHGIRFYKAAANTGTHIGNLWTASGQLLASATFTNETASGWQQVNFASPVPIMPEYDVRRRRTSRPTATTRRPTDYFYPHPSPTPIGGAAPRRPPLHAFAQHRLERQRRLLLQRRQHVPDQHLQRRELLGRRRLHARTPPLGRSPA